MLTIQNAEQGEPAQRVDIQDPGPARCDVWAHASSPAALAPGVRCPSTLPGVDFPLPRAPYHTVWSGPMKLPWVWQATAEEIAAEYPCDRYVESPAASCLRAVDSTADAATVFRSVLPTLGSRRTATTWSTTGESLSPRTTHAGAGRVGARQSVIWTIFSLGRLPARASPHPARLRDAASRRIFGDIAVSYTVTPTTTGSRLVRRDGDPR